MRSFKQPRITRAVTRPDLSVVIYCHNDALTIEEQVRGWREVLREEKVSFELIACNAGSLDGTGRILDNLRREYPELRVLHQLQIGLSQSVRRGYEAARGTFVLQMVGTGQNDPEDFWPMWNKRNRYLLILGDRKHRLDGWVRPSLSKMLGRTIRFFFRVDIQDANVPFRLFRRKALISTLSALPKGIESINICMSLFAKKIEENQVFEVPIPYRLPPKGKVRLSLPRLFGLSFQILTELLRVRLSLRRIMRLQNLAPDIA